ncbi:MAG TPA: transposase [Acidimicrobiales bacterium]
MTFDEPNLVADAELLLVATLGARLGLERLVNTTVHLRGRVGGALPGRKVLSLVHAMAAGGSHIDDADVLRSGATGSALGHRVMPPSTLGTFLRAFTFGQIRQLDRVLGEALRRAWALGAGPGSAPLVIDLDSTICEVCGKAKHGAGFGYTKKLGYHPLIATRAWTGELLHVRMRKGAANTQRGAVRFIEELVARVRRAGASGDLFMRFDSGFWSNTTIATLERLGVSYTMGVRMIKAVVAAVEDISEFAGPRSSTRPTARPRSPSATTRGAASSGAAPGDGRLAIRDLKEGASLEHVPSGNFLANSAWLVCAALAHNLIRWTAMLGDITEEERLIVARTVRTRFLSVPGRLVSRSGRPTLRAPLESPWAGAFARALELLRALPPVPV